MRGLGDGAGVSELEDLSGFRLTVDQVILMFPQLQVRFWSSPHCSAEWLSLLALVPIVRILVSFVTSNSTIFPPNTHTYFNTTHAAWVAIMLIISNYSSNTVHAHVCINPNRNFPTQWIASVILSTFTYIYISPMIWLHLHFQPIGASSIDGTLYSRPMSFLHHVTLIIRDQWI